MIRFTLDLVLLLILINQKKVEFQNKKKSQCQIVTKNFNLNSHLFIFIENQLQLLSDTIIESIEELKPTQEHQDTALIQLINDTKSILRCLNNDPLDKLQQIHDLMTGKNNSLKKLDQSLCSLKKFGNFPK